MAKKVCGEPCPDIGEDYCGHTADAPTFWCSKKCRDGRRCVRNKPVISACCEGARRLETRGVFGGYHCPDHGFTLLELAADRSLPGLMASPREDNAALRSSLKLALKLAEARAPAGSSPPAPARAETADETANPRHPQVEAERMASRPAPDTRGGPFPPSTRGNQTNAGISPARLFDQAYRAGWNDAFDKPGSLDECLADALKKADLP